MVETYHGKLEERGKEVRKKDQVGMLRLEDDKMVFIFDNGNLTEIKFEEIVSVVPQRIRFPKGLKEPLITLKDDRKFILCIHPTYFRSGFAGGIQGVQSAINDNFKALKQGNIKMTKLLNYLIKTVKK